MAVAFRRLSCLPPRGTVTPTPAMLISVASIARGAVADGAVVPIVFTIAAKRSDAPLDGPTVKSGQPAWLTNLVITETTAGTLYTVTADMDPTGLSAGVLSSTLVFEDASGAADKSIGLAFTITAAANGNAVIQPRWSTTDTFNTVEGSGVIDPRTYADTPIDNVGPPGTDFTNLQVTNISAAFIGSATVFTDTNGQLKVRANFDAVAAAALAQQTNPYNCRLTLEDEAAQNPAYIDVPLQVNVSVPVPQPTIVVTPGTLSATFAEGETGTLTVGFVITGNNGNLTDPQVSEDLAFATVAKVVDPTNSQRWLGTLSITKNGKTAGSYSGTVTVTDAAAAQAKAVPVTILVTPAASGTYAPPAWSMPTGASHDPATDEIDYDPFTSAVDVGDFS